MNDSFQELLILFGLTGSILGTAYLWITLQVEKAGEKISFFSSSHDAHLLRRYREVTKTRHYPLWPLYMDWVAVEGSGATTIGMLVALHK
ncbi:MAG: hypothetical protein PVS2B2_09370 [Candidatus Acidiferrum sp.]